MYPLNYFPKGNDLAPVNAKLHKKCDSVLLVGNPFMYFQSKNFIETSDSLNCCLLNHFALIIDELVVYLISDGFLSDKQNGFPFSMSTSGMITVIIETVF